MDRKQIINQRQLAWLAASILTSGGILSLQNVLIRLDEMDAWFCYLLPIIYVFLVASFFAFLARKFPDKNIFEISVQLLGKWGGSLVNLITLFHFWMIVIRDISTYSKFTSLILLDNTPIEILVLIPCLLLVYYGKSSLEVIARVNDVFYPLFVVTIILMPLMLFNEVNYRLAEPLLTIPTNRMGYGNLLAIGGAGDIFILGAFLHTIYKANQIRSSIRHGALIGMVLLTLVTFLEIIVLGPKMPGNFLYPTYNLVQMIHITDFLDRLDIIILTIWFPTIACKMVAIYMAFLMGLSALFKERDYTVFNKPMAMLIAITTLLSFHSTSEVFAFANFCSPVIVLGYQPLTMLLLVIRGKLSRKKSGINEREAGEEGSRETKHGKSADLSPQKDQIPRSAAFSYVRWVQLGNILILACLVFIVIGPSVSRYYPIAGNICAIGYAVGMVLTVATTYWELSRLKQTEA